MPHEIPVQVWGPAGWFLLHSIALTLPDSDLGGADAEVGGSTDDPKGAAVPAAVRIARLVDDLAALLPCRVCGAHLRQFVEDNPLAPPLTRGAVFDWTRRAHNAVNARNGKPELSADEALVAITTVFEERQKWTYP